MKLPFFTIGHSTRSLEELIEILREVRIEIVADIRRIPGSRTNPQFNEETFRQALAAFGISYEHVTALGGRRGKSRSSSDDVNGFWTNASFRNFADYALSAPFHTGLEDLLAEGRRRRCAIMCSEAVWWRCHRRIVADYLMASGETVFHVMGQGRVEPARMTPGAVIEPGPRVVYPAKDRGVD